MREYNRIMLSKGFDPGQPTVLLAVYVDEDPGRAQELGHLYALEYADSARRHYRIDDPSHLAGVQGYEHYSETARKFAEAHPEAEDRRQRMQELAKTVDLKKLSTEELFGVFVNSHVWGTPDQVIEQLKGDFAERAQQFVGVFKFGSMSPREAESSIRLFARTVLPEIHAMRIPPAGVLPEPSVMPAAVSS